MDFVNCSAKQVTGSNAPAFEVQYNWTNVRFTNCAAEDSTLNFTISQCDHVVLNNCTSNNAPFLFEAAGSHAVTFTNCVADRRPTAASPSAGTAGTGEVMFDCSYDVNWIGGSLLANAFHLYYGSNFTMLGVNMHGSSVNCQDSNNVCVEGCLFNALEDGTQVPGWLAVDCGTNDLTNITFRGNHCYGGTQYSGVGVYGNRTVNGLNVINNDSDGAFIPGGYIQVVGSTNVTNHLYAGNTSITQYQGAPQLMFINDPPASTFANGVTLQAAPLPATATAGTIWYDGTHFYGGVGGTWKVLDNSAVAGTRQ